MDQPSSAPTPTPAAATPATPATPVAPAPMPAAAPKKGNKTLVIVLSILGGCCLIVAIAVGFFVMTAKKGIEKAVEEIENSEELQKAYDLQEGASSYDYSYGDDTIEDTDTTTDETKTDASDPYDFESLFKELETKSKTSVETETTTDAADDSTSNGY